MYKRLFNIGMPAKLENLIHFRREDGRHLGNEVLCSIQESDSNHFYYISEIKENVGYFWEFSEFYGSRSFPNLRDGCGLHM